MKTTTENMLCYDNERTQGEGGNVEMNDSCERSWRARTWCSSLIAVGWPADDNRSSNFSEKSSIGNSSPLIAVRSYFSEDTRLSTPDIKLAIAAHSTPVARLASLCTGRLPHPPTEHGVGGRATCWGLRGPQNALVIFAVTHCCRAMSSADLGPPKTIPRQLLLLAKQVDSANKLHVLVKWLEE